MSGTFLFLLARDETGDAGAALVGGALYAFAPVRWTQVEHLGGLSSQWMPLALLLARRVAQAPGGRAVAALAVVAALQVTSSGHHLLFYPPFLAVWAAVEAKRAGGTAPWLRLAAAGTIAGALATPLVLPYVALQATGARRDLKSLVENSADLVTARLFRSNTREDERGGVAHLAGGLIRSTHSRDRTPQIPQLRPATAPWDLGRPVPRRPLVPRGGQDPLWVWRRLEVAWPSPS